MIEAQVTQTYSVFLGLSGVPVTTLTQANILNATLYMIKEGVVTTLVLTGVNFVEINSATVPGMYKITLPALADGQYIFCLSPAVMGTFDDVRIREDVGLGNSKLNSLAKYFLNKSTITQADGILTVYETDKSTVAFKQYLKTDQGSPSIFNIRVKEPV